VVQAHQKWCNGRQFLTINGYLKYGRMHENMAGSKINIVGIGDDGIEGLTTPARQLVQQAELLVGPKQVLTAVAGSKAEKLEIGSDLDAIVKKIEAAGNKKVVVLTAGDPLFYGTARYLC